MPANVLQEKELGLENEKIRIVQILDTEPTFEHQNKQSYQTYPARVPANVPYSKKRNWSSKTRKSTYGDSPKHKNPSYGTFSTSRLENEKKYGDSPKHKTPGYGSLPAQPAAAGRSRVAGRWRRTPCRRSAGT